jgi:hypothetical protein
VGCFIYPFLNRSFVGTRLLARVNKSVADLQCLSAGNPTFTIKDQDPKDGSDEIRAASNLLDGVTPPIYRRGYENEFLA